MLMAPQALRVPIGDRVTRRSVRLILDDATLPDVSELGLLISDLHRATHRWRVYCVTAES
jgi:hypothetical protein